MAFKRVPAPSSFKWPVEVPEPADGEFKRSKFIAIFKRVGRAEWAKLTEEKGDTQLLSSVLIGWEDMVEEDGTPIPYSPEQVAEFADDFYWSNAVLGALTSTFTGAALGN